MPYQELEGLGMAGLNTDTPAQALDHTQFSGGINMRPFDGSLQTVFTFDDTEGNITPSDRLDVYSFTHFIQTGAAEFRAAYLFNNGTAAEPDIELQIIDDITGGGSIVPGDVTMNAPIEFNERWGTQLFTFNGLLIVNDGTNQPVYVTVADSGTPPVAGFILGWPNGSDTDDQTQADLADRVTCERMIPYNGRLVAINMSGDYIQSDTNMVNLGNASLIWSTPITELDSLNGVTFKFASTNSAGDDILTETPGELIDGGQLGEYLIIYKDDAVYRYLDAGDPLYLVGEVLFTDDGIFAPDCFIDIGGGRHFVMGNFGCYIHDGGPNKQNVSRGKVQEELYSGILSQFNTFLFHNTNDKEVWICYETIRLVDGINTKVNQAHVFNYEQGVWHKRDLPPGTRGITTTQQDGQIYVYAFGDDGVKRLFDERQTDATRHIGDVQFHYLGISDHSKVKHVKAIYPHTMSSISYDIQGVNNYGKGIPVFDYREMNYLASEEYKADVRIHGRYIHLALQSDPGTNPMLTSVGMVMRLGGDR